MQRTRRSFVKTVFTAIGNPHVSLSVNELTKEKLSCRGGTAPAGETVVANTAETAARSDAILMIAPFWRVPSSRVGRFSFT